MRFQYSLIVNISLVDEYQTLNFGTQIGSNERNKGLLTALLKKNSDLGKQAILGPKQMHPHISGNFFKILHNKRGQQVEEIDINDCFQKKIVWGKWTIFGPKMMHPHSSGFTVRFFKKFCPVKKGQQVDESKNNCTKKKFVQDKLGYIGAENGTSWIGSKIFFF